MDDGEVIPYADMCQIMLARIRTRHTQASGGDRQSALCPRVIDAFGRVPRQDYVPELIQFFAYMDSPLPIGHQKTIPQPYIAALMTHLLAVEPGQSVLEIGTGLGFHAAVLAEMGADVHTVEIVSELAEDARRRLEAAGYSRIQIKCGDGRFGWPEAAPFDRILVTASSELLPPDLVSQLAPGGRMVLPCGPEGAQKVTLVEKGPDGSISLTESIPGVFAWLEGDAAEDAFQA